ncbi:Predicted E3 ubiquitin ligase [Phaffia rhodozyma]|uniref:RING-type E3 ubiquitin transferase (cysteine targeting) n=1 Tax=Phaffia rhodozyma TaxID=264483 RepID=A0A0F7SR77_PHARH|nr:Predicted E3 ubiquitin ligase [Phaffia rhodozyma]
MADRSVLPNVLRVGQLDAAELDDALVNMLGGGLASSLDNFGSSYKLTFQPELYLLISLITYKYCMWDRLVTPGSQLENLKYKPERWNGGSSKHRLRTLLLLHLFLSPQMFPRYILQRFKQYALSRSWPDLPRRSLRKRIWDGVNKLEDLGRAGELAGLLWFLYDGRYPSLLTRLLGLRLVPSSSKLTRMVSYEFMNRQLVWGSLSQFMPHILPLAPYVLGPLSRIQHGLTSTLSTLTDPLPIYPSSLSLKPRSDMNSQTAPPNSDSSLFQSSSSHRPHEGIYSKIDRRACPLCYSRSDKTGGNGPCAPGPIPSMPLIPQLSPLAQSADSSNPSFGSTLEEEKPKEEEEEEEEDESVAVHIPVRADCWAGCIYCYACLGGALLESSRSELSMAMVSGEGSSELKVRQEKGWDCLRCGGEVFGGSMVKAVPIKEEENENDTSASEGL